MARISEYVPEVWEYMTRGKGQKLPGHARELIGDMAQELADFRALSPTAEEDADNG